MLHAGSGVFLVAAWMVMMRTDEHRPWGEKNGKKAVDLLEAIPLFSVPGLDLQFLQLCKAALTTNTMSCDLTLRRIRYSRSISDKV